MKAQAVGPFERVVEEIAQVGFKHHRQTLLEHALINAPQAKQSIKDLPDLKGPKARSAIVISAGPSVHRQHSLKRIKDLNYPGTLICVDGAFIAALKAGLIPDFVMALDPHRRRPVRWFGDHDFEKNTADDDYFARQDLDVEFRKNTIAQNKLHIELVNTYGPKTKAIVASCAAANVVGRIQESGMDAYWWNPLVDDPHTPGSITRAMYDINRLPCLNTGGNVGTAAWVFADSFLKIPEIALVGMDFGYYGDLPFEKTQTFYELHQYLQNAESVESLFVEYDFPLTGETFYTDPTYYWYRKNFLELFLLARGRTYNCTEGGTLFHEKMPCLSLDDFIQRHL